VESGFIDNVGYNGMACLEKAYFGLTGMAWNEETT
jgi:hypothetical protein